MLKAWGTGHPGGIATVHATTRASALYRLEQLIQEAVVTVPRRLIAETIDLIAVLAGRGAARRLAGIGVRRRARSPPATTRSAARPVPDTQGD